MRTTTKAFRGIAYEVLISGVMVCGCVAADPPGVIPVFTGTYGESLSEHQ
eukprot:gene29203-8151_t